MKKLSFALALLLILLLLVGCSQREILLLDNDHLTITRRGAETTITDNIGGEVYTLHSVHKRHTEAKTASRVVHTDSIIITVLPGGGFHIVSGGNEYLIYKRGAFT